MTVILVRNSRSPYGRKRLISCGLQVTSCGYSERRSCPAFLYKDRSSAVSCGPCRRALSLAQCCASHPVFSFPLPALAKTSHLSADRLECLSPSEVDCELRSNGL